MRLRNYGLVSAISLHCSHQCQYQPHPPKYRRGASFPFNMLQSSSNVVLGRVSLPKRFELNVLNAHRTMIMRLPKAACYLIGGIFRVGFSNAKTYRKLSSASQQPPPSKHHSRLVCPPLEFTKPVARSIWSCLRLSLTQHRRLTLANPSATCRLQHCGPLLPLTRHWKRPRLRKIAHPCCPPQTPP